ncbi:MAG: DNA-protecting protein DprA [Bacteroidales bacterium]|jgi:DNA processing protein|nr:DNA-protecting protein DprA [Bacteroidales bacterium]
MNEEIKYIIALTRMRGIGSIRARLLIDTFGSAKNVFDADAKLLQKIPHVGQKLLEQRSDPTIFERTEKEVAFIQKNHIQPLIYGGEGYPKRLLDCPDAPALLFHLGKTDLDSTHILSIVGTRNCSQYGRDMVKQLVSELKATIPNILIVSGLALGIDISAHRAALENDMTTLGIVAHGLDRIYPAAHRNVASEMIGQGGGLLTEYCTGTEPERGNFLARNRIIAGMADAILVAESRDKGGSLTTASIALDYGRDVFAFPGRATDEKSQGCNRLIRTNRAGLITCADDLLEAMNWGNHGKNKKKAVQQSINFEEENLSPIGRQIMDLLQERGDLRLSQLTDALPDVDRAVMLEELLDLEMDDKIRACPGGLYQRK